MFNRAIFLSYCLLDLFLTNIFYTLFFCLFRNSKNKDRKGFAFETTWRNCSYKGTLDTESGVKLEESIRRSHAPQPTVSKRENIFERTSHNSLLGRNGNSNKNVSVDYAAVENMYADLSQIRKESSYIVPVCEDEKGGELENAQTDDFIAQERERSRSFYIKTGPSADQYTENTEI